MNRINMKYRRRRIFARQKGKCNYCNIKLENNLFCIDHVKPLAFGGSHDDENLQALCIICNLEKNKRENYCKQGKGCKNATA